MASGQFDLFGEGEKSPAMAEASGRRGAKKADQDVLPTTFDDATRELALRLPSGVHLGTSSWSFSGWAGLVYGGTYEQTQLARRGLPAYAAHPLFKTVGIDRTFYGAISESEYRRYAAQARAVSPDFRFLIKAPMLFTGPSLRGDDGRWSDNPAFLNAGMAATQFVLPATTGLAEMCGPLVFQFPPLPPRLTRTRLRFADLLAEFLLALPRLSGDAFYAVEVRDPELLTDDYLAALCAGGATHCIAIHARMPPAFDQARYWMEAGSLPLVLRWSLHSGLKYEEAKERYAPFNAIVDEDPDGRAQVAALLARASGAGRKAFVVVNNKAEGSAPLTVRNLAELLGQSR